MTTLVALTAVLLASGPVPAAPIEPPPPAPPASPATRAPPAVVVHGGAGSARVRMDATGASAQRGLEVLREGGSALDAAIAAVVRLEDDCRFNAGTGANLRMDGKTVQMDAAVMDGATGGFGAVAAIERVKNPVLVARKVLETPHLLIVGDGATRFARAMGFRDHDPVCPESRARYERVRRILSGKEQGTVPAWRRYDWRKAWNFPGPIPAALKEALGTPDTVGAVVRDAEGRFAAAISTGGTTITFDGRVGDVPIYAAGIYAGPHGAVACTGNGEDIVKRLVAKTVYDDLARGAPAQEAVERALEAFPPEVDLGVVALSADGEGGGCNYSAERKAFDRRYRENMAWSVAR
ncbi:MULTISPECIES: isoaspartyl peptidase/L-asparaginase [Anaeromyxobacter]|uniref:isoaspartyl peptidase/L-asparaginase n=1 Tax=Anaeromyxobacter TaxID=161492 RepID=UPI001F5960B5|nr:MULTISPECIES: isoaspartyl peptidase/L-asparaginase [unclassified Anaeromyxobacter]